jgi:hypothetical protein
MHIKTSSHARFRLKQRFNKCPSFGGVLQDDKLKFVRPMPDTDADVYKYDWCGRAMYLFIGQQDKNVITVLTPKMYFGWKKRWAIRKGLETIIKITGIPPYKTMGLVPKIVNFFAPHND